MVRLNVENSTMAAPGIDASNRSGEDTAEMQRMLEKAIRDIRAVDLEALCIAAGRKVLPALSLTASSPHHAMFTKLQTWPNHC